MLVFSYLQTTNILYLLLSAPRKVNEENPLPSIKVVSVQSITVVGFHEYRTSVWGWYRDTTGFNKSERSDGDELTFSSGDVTARQSHRHKRFRKNTDETKNSHHNNDALIQCAHVVHYKKNIQFGETSAG